MKFKDRRIIVYSVILVFCYCLIGLTSGGCSSSKKVDEKSSPDQSEGNEMMDVPDPDRLSPGTALVKVTEIKVADGQQSKDDMEWIITINEVLGYGSATPPLAPGGDLLVGVSSYFKNVEADPQQVMNKKKPIILIQHQQVMAPAASSGWSLVEIFEQ